MFGPRAVEAKGYDRQHRCSRPALSKEGYQANSHIFNEFGTVSMSVGEDEGGKGCKFRVPSFAPTETLAQ
eukprot:scaffold64274_cov18-Prasinocladus_malaysianus.AAC.1